MPTKLDTHTFGRTPKYDFDKLFDGSIWRMEAGKDFTASTASLRVYLYTTAKKRGVKIKVSVDGADVVVQAQR